MNSDRMTLAEFASAEGMSQMSATNALRADYARPLHERRYPFIESQPPVPPATKWNYHIPRGQYAQWKSGNLPQPVDVESLSERVAEKVFDRLATAFMRGMEVPA